MRAIIYSMFLIAFCYGCSTVRRQEKTLDRKNDSAEFEMNSQNIGSHNITNYSFFVEKADFSFESGEEERSGMLTIKYNIPDKYLISIKTKTGIELARIYITGDSVKINDRINKKIYYGSDSYIKRLYGVDATLLPVLLGDYINAEQHGENKILCQNGKMTVNSVINDLNISYTIDCRNGKSVVTTAADKRNGEKLNMEYGKFQVQNGISIPGLINVVDNQHNIKIKLRISKVTVPWDGVVEFIPGRQYEKIHLL